MLKEVKRINSDITKMNKKDNEHNSKIRKVVTLRNSFIKAISINGEIYNNDAYNYKVQSKKNIINL